MLIIPLIYSWVCLLLKKLCERVKRFHSNDNLGRFSRGTRETVLPLEGELISASLEISNIKQEGREKNERKSSGAGS